jgi:hypothetical protein
MGGFLKIKSFFILTILFLGQLSYATSPFDSAYTFFANARQVSMDEVSTNVTEFIGKSIWNNEPTTLKDVRLTLYRSNDPIAGSRVIAGQYSLTPMSNGELGYFHYKKSGFNHEEVTLFLRKQILGADNYWVLYQKIRVWEYIPPPDSGTNSENVDSGGETDEVPGVTGISYFLIPKT